MDQNSKEKGRTIREPVAFQTNGDRDVPGLRVRDATDEMDRYIAIEEFGRGPMLPRDIWVEREEVPAVIEALVDQARQEDLEEIEQRVLDAVHWGDDDPGIHVTD